MAIIQFETKDFLVFQGDFSAHFCSGVNILIGGNGTGKTTLMKMMYITYDYADILYESSKRGDEKLLPVSTLIMNSSINGYFNDIKNTKELHINLINIDANKNDSTIKIYTSDAYITTNVTMNEFNGSTNYTFIPTDDVLSHSKGFLALYKERELPFDATFVDVLAKAELPVTRVITPNATKILSKISKIIGGEVLYENDTFYINKGNNKIPFSLEASGFRKFGLLWKLLRNGLLEKGSTLFWDEPENSLNPELIPVLVDILLELSENDVQIFLATHDYNLARHFDIRKNKSVPVLYHNLCKMDNGQIICESLPEYTKLPNNSLERANENLFEAVVSNAMGEYDG